MKNPYFTLGVAFMLSPIFSYGQASCTPHQQLGIGSGSSDYSNKVANDFILSSNITNFSAGSMSLNIKTSGGIESVDIMFYTDYEGAPGDPYGETITNLVPSSQVTIGVSMEYAIDIVTLDFPIPIDFVNEEGSTTAYWIQVVATPGFVGTYTTWVSINENVIGSLCYYYQEENDIGWTELFGDGVFTLSGECTYASGCLFPENVSIDNTTTNSSEITWTEVGSATEWNVEYGPMGFVPGEGTLINDDNGTLGVTISGLEPRTDYDVYVNSVCGEDDESVYNGPTTFSTDDYYCPVSVILSVLPITHVEFAGIENFSTAMHNSPAHEYFLDQQAAVNTGEFYPIALEGNSEGELFSFFTLFVDWDQDDTFNNLDERYDIGYIQGSTGEDGQQTTGNIEVPIEAFAGTTRMRVVKIHSSNWTGITYTTDACTSLVDGQVEDYMVEVGTDATVDFDKYGFAYGPNPTKGSVQLTATKVIEKVSVLSVLGQKVFGEEHNAVSPDIDLTSLANGTYFMEVTIENERKTFKIVKE